MSTPPPSRRWATTAGLVVLAIATRLASWWSTRSRPLTSDAGQYHELATHLAEGAGYVHQFPQLELHPTAFRPPLFPGLLGIVYRITGPSVGIGRAVAVMIGVALVVVVHRSARRHLPERTAVLAAALVATYPPLVANDTVPLTEGLSLVLIVVLVNLAVDRRWMGTGVVCGLLVLTRPSAQALAVVVGAWLVGAVGWRRALGSVAVAALVVTPWVARNAVVVGTPTVATSNGFNLAAIYSAPARQAGGFVDPVFHPGFDDQRLLQFDEAAWDAELRRQGLEGIAEHPAYVATVVGHNVAATLELPPSRNDAAESLDVRNMDVRRAALPAFYVVTVAGVVGCWRERRNPWVQLLAIVAMSFLVASLGLVAPPRLRAPLDLACCVGAAVSASWLVDRWRRSLPAAAEAAPACPTS